MPANRPTVVELLDAIRGFLKDDVAAQVTGHVAYHLRVAVNAIAILERELAEGPRCDADEQARLQALLGISGTRDDLNRGLCARIRARALTYKNRELMDHLLRTAMDKIAIDNPKYATYVRASESGDLPHV